MKRKTLVMLVILALTCWITPASASMMTWETWPGITESGGNPIDALVTITTLSNEVDITITNKLANPKSVAQCLSGLAFVLTSFTQTGSISETSSSSQNISIASGGTVSPGSTVATGWVLSQTGSLSFLLNDLGTGGAGPTDTLIGPADTGGTYSNANASIAGNGPHNPFLNQTASFVLSIPGVNSGTGIESATFYFGTCPGDGVYVPIPPSALLLGSGLLGLVGLGWRKRS